MPPRFTMDIEPDPRLTRRRRWPRRLVAAAIVCGLTVALVGAELRSQNGAKAQLDARFQLRAPSAGSFIELYAQDLLVREARLATERLSTAVVTDPQLAAFLEDFGFGPAVLLDRDGNDLMVAPATPGIVGTNLAAKYAHLRAAEAG